MTDGQRATRFAPALIVVMITLPNLLRNRHDLAAMLPRWAPAIEQLLLVIAGCIVVAAVAFGVRAWRDAKRAG